MAKSLQLRLKSNYREPLTSGVGFVGREAEVARLTAVLRHRASATVLVSGHRGVGKTTLVDEAIRQAQDERSLVVRLSLPHVHPETSEVSREIRGQILRSLARSLYFTIKDSGVDKDLKQHAEELYEKTYLRELQEQGHLATLTEAEAHSSQIRVNETRIEPGKTIKALLGSLGAAAIAAGGVAVGARIAQDHGPLLGVLALVLVFASAVAAGVLVTKRSETNESATSRVTGERTTSRSGSFDLSPETLEFELQDLLTGLRKKKVRTIFVIDELDKLEVEAAPEALESHVIFTILSSLKNFFTLGAGIYVFISGEDFYARLEESIDEHSYSLAHTLFTDRLFLHVLPYSDVERLIDGLLESEPEDQETYRQLRNFLCWESRNHVFDLLTLLGDFVSEYDGDIPIAHAHESYESDGRWHEGNLPPDWLLASALQKVVGATFDESARPGGRDERFNQALWLTLLDVAKRVADDYAIYVPKDGYVLSSSRWTSRLQERDWDDLAGAVDRLLAHGERYGILTATQTTIARSDDGEEPDELEAIEYAVISNFVYPDSSVGTHASPSPFEKGFLKVAAAVGELFERLEDAGLTPGEYSDGIDTVRKVAQAVETRPNRKSPPRSEVRAALQTADRLYATLLEQAIYELAGSWATDRGLDFTFDLSGAEAGEAASPRPKQKGGQPAPVTEEVPSLGEFDTLRTLILENGIGHVLVSASDRENQILIIQGVAPGVAPLLHDAYQDASPGRKGQERRVQRLPIVQVQPSRPDEPIDLPNEVVTVVEENPFRGFVARMMWWLDEPPPAERQVTETLAGWNIFNLDPSGSNIGELRDLLDSVSYLTDEQPA